MMAGLKYICVLSAMIKLEAIRHLTKALSRGVFFGYNAGLGIRKDRLWKVFLK